MPRSVRLANSNAIAASTTASRWSPMARLSTTRLPSSVLIVLSAAKHVRLCALATARCRNTCWNAARSVAINAQPLVKNSPTMNTWWPAQNHAAIVRRYAWKCQNTITSSFRSVMFLPTVDRRLPYGLNRTETTAAGVSSDSWRKAKARHFLSSASRFAI